MSPSDIYLTILCLSVCRDCKDTKKHAAAAAHADHKGEHAKMNGQGSHGNHTDIGINAIKKASTLTFDDVICNDRSNHLGPRFEDSLIITTPLLDELIDKVHLFTRIDLLEKKLSEKVAKNLFNSTEKELRLKLNTKVEHEEFAHSMSKKASVSELSQFRENLYRQLDDIRNTLSNSVIQGGSVAGMVAASVGKTDPNTKNNNGIDDKTLHALALERAETLERFDLLYKQFGDLS